MKNNSSMLLVDAEGKPKELFKLKPEYPNITRRSGGYETACDKSGNI